MSKQSNVFCFAVSVKGVDHETLINARTAGKAKYQHWLNIIDCMPDLPITAMRARKVGPPHTSDQFMRNASYRGIPQLRCGQRVKVGEASGFVVGHNSSANLDVLFDDDSPRYAGMTLNVHPDSCVIQEIEK